MPQLALVLSVIWFLALFVLRVWIQWRKTGSTGIKGFRGRVGSIPWFAGSAASAGLFLTPLSPIAALQGWSVGTLVPVSIAVQWLGAGLVLAGIGGGLIAQLAMGASWRIGVDDSEQTTLVTHGLYSTVRNPIFSFVAASALGFVLLVPNLLSVTACVLTLIGIEMQVRAVEEPYLLRVHGQAYRAYTDRVGRFVPGFGRLSDG